EVVHGPEGPVARWVCTRVGARPVVAHAGWRTDPDVAAQVVLRTSARARTPEPLRRARELARVARAVAGAGRPTGLATAGTSGGAGPGGTAATGACRMGGWRRC